MDDYVKSRCQIRMDGMDDLPRELKELVWRYGKLATVQDMHADGYSRDAIETVLKSVAIEEYKLEMEMWTCARDR